MIKGFQQEKVPAYFAYYARPLGETEEKPALSVSLAEERGGWENTSWYDNGTVSQKYSRGIRQYSYVWMLVKRRNVRADREYRWPVPTTASVVPHQLSCFACSTHWYLYRLLLSLHGSLLYLDTSWRCICSMKTYPIPESLRVTLPPPSLFCDELAFYQRWVGLDYHLPLGPGHSWGRGLPHVGRVWHGTSGVGEQQVSLVWWQSSRFQDISRSIIMHMH